MRDYALLVFVLGLVPLILYQAWVGALAWTWIGLMNPHLYTWELKAFPFAQVIGIAFLAGWILARDRKMFPLTPGIVFLCLLYVFVTLKTPVSWNLDVAWDKWKEYTKVVVAALMIGTLIYSRRRVRWFLWVILLSIGVTYGIKGGVFAIASGGQLHVQGPEPSFIGGNNSLGIALLMVAPLFVAFWRDTSNRWLKLGAVGGLGLTLVAIIFTYSRGAWLGLVAVSFLLFLQSKRKGLVLALVVPLAFVGAALIPEKVYQRADTIENYKEDLSAMQRIQGWGVAVNVALQHPLGSGFVLDATPVDVWMTYANFHHPAFDRSNAAHSNYFQMIGDHGFGGLALFLMVVAGTFWTLARVRLAAQRDKQLEWLGHYATALMIGLVGYCVSGAFVSLAYFDLFYTFVVLAGILARETEATAIPQNTDSVTPTHGAFGPRSESANAAISPTKMAS